MKSYRIIIIFLLLTLSPVTLTCQDFSVKNKSKTDNPKQKLDSIVTFLHEGFLKRTHQQTKTTFSYNAMGKVVNQKYFQWDSYAGQCLMYMETGNLYDSTGSINQQIETIWSTPGTLNRKSKDEFAYDSYGRETLKMSYEWDTVNSSWIEISLRRKFYDRFGNDSVLIEIDNNESACLYHTRHLYQYDVNQRLIKITRSDLNTRTGQWDISGQALINNDKNGNQVSRVGYIDGEQLQHSYIAYVFDISGNRIEGFYCHSEPDTQKMVMVRKMDYKYDFNGKVVLVTDSSLNDRLNKMVLSSRQEYQYDSTGKMRSKMNFEVNEYNYPHDYSLTEWNYSPDGDVIQLWKYTCKTPGECLIEENTSYTYDENRNIKMIKSILGKGLFANKAKQEFIYNNALDLENLIVPSCYQDLIFSLYFNKTIPHENCNNRVDGFSWKIYLIIKNYGGKGKLYYSDM